jgi:two-component system OmpR family response regulator
MIEAPFSRILHVDDQKDIRGIVQLALGKIGGFTVQCCASGDEALSVAAQYDPELLLLDVNMPNMDGLELLARLRGAGIGAPAVFFTAKANPRDFENYRAVGAIGAIAKPFDPLKLSNQLIAFWNDHAQSRQAAT